MSDPLQIHELFGPMLVGLVISAMFGGITIVQALMFLKTSKSDPLQHKIAVYFLLTLDTVHLWLFAHSIYYYLVSNPDEKLLVWSVPAFMLLHNIVMPIVQFFYVARIWKLVTRSRIYIPIFLNLMTLVNLSLGILISVKLFQNIPFEAAMQMIPEDITKALFATRFCSDVVIAGSTIYYLTQAGTYLSWTDSTSTMLLAYLLNSGVIPSLLSIAIFATALVSPESLVFLMIEEIAIKLYVNSFMGMLNARYYLQSPSPKPTPDFFFPSKALSQTGPIDEMQAQMPAKTINEVGLPLFQSDSGKHETDRDIRLEVMIKQDTQRAMT